jgi:hypothetical protein
LFEQSRYALVLVLFGCSASMKIDMYKQLLQ